MFFKNASIIPTSGTTFHFSGLGEPWINPKCTDMVSIRTRERKCMLSPILHYLTRTIEDLERMKDIPFVLFQVHVPDKRGLFHEVKTHSSKRKIRSFKRRIFQSFVLHVWVVTQLIGQLIFLGI
jgi:hypothetical protein